MELTSESASRELRPAFRPEVLYLRGALALLFVLVSISLPGPTLVAISLWVGSYLFIDGVAALFLQNAGARSFRSYGWSLVSGVLGIVAGALTFLNPLGTAYALGFLTGIWAAALGLLEISGAFEMRRAYAIGSGVRAAMVALGGAAVLVGALVLLRPELGLVTLLVLAATRALITGLSSIILGAEVRRCLREGLCPPRLFDDHRKERRSA